MHDRTPDDALARLESELRESRTQAWDVETFLAKRHQAKIEALTATPEATWASRWQVTKELFWGLMAVVGYLATLTTAAAWLLTGEFPIHEHTSAHAVSHHSEKSIIPPPAGLAPTHPDYGQ